MVLLIILIDNLHAGGILIGGTLVLLQQFSNNVITNYFIFTRLHQNHNMHNM